MDLKCMILATANHPLYEELKNSGHKFFDIRKDEPYEEKYSNYADFDYIFDFCLLSRAEKHATISRMGLLLETPIISELSCYWGDGFLARYPLIHGAISCAFQGGGEAFEYVARDEATQMAIQTFFQSLGRKGVALASAGIGFIFPRILVQIINEAYFSLEQGLATREDIDRAMCYGVNYPKGPFQWCQEIGPDKVVMLLDKLFMVTKELRYRTCPLLRIEAGQVHSSITLD